MTVLSQSVGRAAAILDTLANETNGSGVTAIARQLSMDKSTVHRLLRSLVASGLVCYDAESRKYRLGDHLVGLGVLAQRRLLISQRIQPLLVRLRDLTGETVTLFMPMGTQRVAFEQVLSHKEHRALAQLSHLRPLDVGGAGLAMLAFQTPAFLEQYLRQRPQTSARSYSPWPTNEALIEVVNEVRERGYAIAQRTAEGYNSLAFPVLNEKGALLGAISILGPEDRFDLERIDAVVPACWAMLYEVNMAVRDLEPPRL